jgi:broad specificity phosphatase PhoE
MKLFLIRHGETDWSRQKRYCGATDISLNKTGKEQAIKLGQRLQQEQIQQIYASNSQRTIQFANLAFPKKTILERAQLQELDFGPWEGLKHHEVESTYPDIYSRWLADPFKVTIGESLNIFIKY